MNPYARRRATNSIVLGLSLTATAFGLVWLALILWTLPQPAGPRKV